VLSAKKITDLPALPANLRQSISDRLKSAHYL
jgi:hypothetical protein